MKLELEKNSHHLVLIPGLDGTGRFFDPLLKALPSDFDATVVTFPHDKAMYDRDLFAIIRNLIPWDREFFVVAESTSGPLGVRFAAAQRENVRGIVLASSFVSNPIEARQNWATTFLSRPWYEKEATPASVRKHLLGKDVSDALVSELVDALQTVWPAVLARRIELALRVDARDALKNWTKPVLYLRADDDAFVGIESVNEIASLRPGSKIVTIPGPHLILQANPRTAADAIRDFVRGCSAADSVPFAA